MKKTDEEQESSTQLLSQYSYNNLPAVITKVLSFFGRYQIALFFAFNLNGLIYGINHTLTAFHIYTPTFRCKEYNDTPNTCEFKNGTSCPSEFVFNDDDYTIVTEWSLVCSRRLLAPLVNTLYFSGVTFGALICGILSDKFGRKKILLLCLFSQGILGLLLRTATVLELFMIMRTMQGFFVQGLQGVCIAMLFEYSPPRLRTTAGVTWYIHYSLGLIYLGSVSYGIRDWRLLQVVVSIPAMVIACYIWAIPESVSWLYATNRKREALKLCLKTSRLNGDVAMVEEIKSKFKDKLNSKANDEVSDSLVVEKATLKDIWKTNSLRKHLIVMIFVNYAIAVSYFGTVYFLNNLSGDRHLNFILSACLELIAYIFVFIFLSKLGRRFSIIMYQYFTACLCAAIGIIIVCVPDTAPQKPMLVTILSLLAKGCGISAFCTMSIYNSELFPTICRGAAFGTCGFWARVGSVSAPFLMISAEYMSPIFPMSILSVLLFATGTASFFLPETLNKILPNTIAEAKNMWEINK